MIHTNEPLISCLCVTENRPSFLPWLLWNYDKQTWDKRELVIVDSSIRPFESDRPHVRVIPAPAGTNVPAKRNLALQTAEGDIIVWFDDDDWQHPEKLTLLEAGLRDENVIYTGTKVGWFVDLATGRCRRHRGAGDLPIFNSAAFRREAAHKVSFPEKLHKASDTRWMQGIKRRYPGRAKLLKREDLFFWLCHDTNLSNQAGRRSFPKALPALKEVVGVAWQDTDEQMAALAGRLNKGGEAPTSSKQPRIEVKSERIKEQYMTNETAVSVMIKATALDTPYLAVMARHMIAQAHFPFTERVVIVERRRLFQGKYRDRPQTSDAELDHVLTKLLEDGIIDTVREVDPSPAKVNQVMDRYFARNARRIPTHAVTGGPIYATLFGLESMATDYVLQMDADVFFYSDKESWVKQSLACMVQDEKLWLMMTHPGPPAGPPGKSMGDRNKIRATWDSALKLWRFQHATTRYFLCDRRQLHGRLQPMLRGSGSLPLEQCLSATLQRYGAFRGNLGDLTSWHLHAWYHNKPFPEWASRLAQAVAAGLFPDSQTGEYDLRLDQVSSRQDWQATLQKVNQPAKEIPVEKRPKRTVPAELKAPKKPLITQAKQAPLSVVIPIRNRSGQRVRNALYSLNWQTAGRPSQIIVVSHGSRPSIDEDLAVLCQEQGATLFTIGAPSQPWNKSLALNTGIRACQPDTPFLMTMDTDMILAPNFFATVLAHMGRDSQKLVLCRISDLTREVELPRNRADLLEAFEQLHAKTRLRARSGSGGIQAAPRKFFFDIRGYDEDLLWWGAMDGDILNRARVRGLRLVWIENETAMLHQWHPRKHQILNRPGEVKQARWYWQQNHKLVRQRANIARRNPDGWGIVFEN